MTYPDADLVTGYIAAKGAKTVHTEGLEAGVSWCELRLNTLIAAGWLRGLLRHGGSECAKCRKARLEHNESLENGPESALEVEPADTPAPPQ